MNGLGCAFCVSEIIYDNMPMFYSQINTRDQVNDLVISFCAIRGFLSNQASMQVAPFEQVEEICAVMKKLYLKRNGDGNIQVLRIVCHFYNRFIGSAAPKWHVSLRHETSITSMS
jgi:hypothetical protein